METTVFLVALCLVGYNFLNSNDLPKVGFVTELLIITHFLKPIIFFGTLQRLASFISPLGELSSNFGMQRKQHTKQFETIKCNIFWNSE